MAGCAVWSYFVGSGGVEWLRHAFEKNPAVEHRKDCKGRAWAGIILRLFSVPWAGQERQEFNSCGGDQWDGVGGRGRTRRCPGSWGPCDPMNTPGWLLSCQGTPPGTGEEKLGTRDEGPRGGCASAQSLRAPLPRSENTRLGLRASCSSSALST